MTLAGRGGGGSNPNIVTGKLISDGKILQDGESSAIVMDNSLRWWKLTEPVRVETNNATTANGSLAEVKDNQIRITSYSLYAIKNVDVYGDGTKLFTIANLPALAEQVYELPNGEKNTDYTNYSVKSSDAHYKKIAGGKMLKTLYFAKSNSQWADLGPLEAREYIAFWTNLAFTFSSPEFETLLKNYKQLTGLEFTDDHNSNGTITKHDLTTDTVARDKIKNGIFVEKTLGIGLVGSEKYDSDGKTVGGQAYAGSLAVTPVNLTVAYYLGLGVGVHEFGHTIDYDHESSFSKDLQEYSGGLSACFVRLGKAPYCSIDLQGYHKEENSDKRKIKNPNQEMLTTKYNEAKIQRENTQWYKAIVTGKGMVMFAGKNPNENPNLIGDQYKTNISDQFVNVFEKAVYNNKTLYPNLYSALEAGGYFKKAKAAGIL